jgi:hypothetical protein
MEIIKEMDESNLYIKNQKYIKNFGVENVFD